MSINVIRRKIGLEELKTIDEATNLKEE